MSNSSPSNSPSVVDLDGHARAVRDRDCAAPEPSRETRPRSSADVRRQLPRFVFLAVGEQTRSRQLCPRPAAFADPVADWRARIDSGRISATTWRLAKARRTSDELLRASAYADLRKRAETRAVRSGPGLRRPRRGSPLARQPTRSWLSCRPECGDLLSTAPVRRVCPRDPRAAHRDCLSSTVRREIAPVPRRAVLPGSQVTEALPWNHDLREARRRARLVATRRSVPQPRICATSTTPSKRQRVHA